MEFAIELNKPDYAGVWFDETAHKLGFITRLPTSAPFLVYVEPSVHPVKVSGTILDCIGMARFHGILSKDNVDFDKTYFTDSDGKELRRKEHTTFCYRGSSDKSGLIRGDWTKQTKGKTVSGEFLMQSYEMFLTSMPVSTTLAREWAMAQIDSLQKQYASLESALKRAEKEVRVIM